MNGGSRPGGAFPRAGAARDRFVIPDGVVYLDGNSLGPPTTATEERLRRFAADEWGAHLVGGWEADGWIGLGVRLGARIAPLVGAAADEVIVCDSTSVNLFKLLHAALDLRPGRRVILAADDDFPTDVFLADAVAAARGRTVRRVDPAAMARTAMDDVAVVVCSHVHFRTSRVHDMAGITAAAHAAGALVLWDLSHSVGALPVDLAGCGVDLAVGCTYKYLNGGPGAPAFAHVARGLQERLSQPIAGWLGHASPFAFEAGYRPAPGVGRLVTGTPPVAAYVALEAALDVWDGVHLPSLRAVGAALGERFVRGVEARLPGTFALRSPREPAVRGSHVALGHRDGYPIVRALVARGVVGDFRAPDALRFGFAPLYLTTDDVDTAVDALAEVMTSGAWRDPRFAERGTVT